MRGRPGATRPALVGTSTPAWPVRLATARLWTHRQQCKQAAYRAQHSRVWQNATDACCCHVQSGIVKTCAPGHPSTRTDLSRPQLRQRPGITAADRRFRRVTRTGRGLRPRLRVGLLLLLLLAGSSALLRPQTAEAHATLVRSEPAVAGGYADAPRSITLWFSETLEADYSRIDLLRPDGSRATTNTPTALAGSTEPALQLLLDDALSDGAYTVVWSVLSAVDGHVSNGVFSFTVGDAALPGTDTEAALAASVTADGPVPLAVEAAVRWGSLLGGTLLVGALLFLPLILLPVTVAAGQPVPTRRWRRLLGGALLLTAVGHLASAVVQIMDASRSTSLSLLGEPLLSLLSDTRFGALWLARGVVLLSLALLLWSLLRGRQVPGLRLRSRIAWYHAVGVGGLLLLTTSLGSHAAARSGALRWPIINDWLHLAGAAVWAGGLPALLLVLHGSGVTLSLPQRAQVIGRFTRWALGALLVLIGSGVLAARQFVVSFDGVTNTDYGRWFVVKLLAIVAAAGFGAWHLLVVRPSLLAGTATDASPPQRAAAARDARSMRWTLPLETALAVLTIAAAGVLTASIPASVVLESSGTSYGETRLSGGESVTLRATPGQIGTNEFSVFVDPGDDENYPTIQRVYLEFSQPQRAPTPQRFQMQATPDPFTFRGTGAFVALDGTWEVQVIIRRAGLLDLVVPFAITADDDGLRPLGIAAPGVDNAPLRAGLLLGGLLLAALAAVGWAWLRLKRLTRAA